MESPATKMWSPNFAQTNMSSFMKEVNKKYNLSLGTYWELYDWSVEHYNCFWETFSSFAKIIYSEPYTQVVDVSKKIEDVPKWFLGARLNYAENLLRFNDEKRALYITGEAYPIPKGVTYRELNMRVAQYALALKNIGIKSGDRVVGYLPNSQEAVEAYLATASIGAVWSSTSPDFGVTAVLDRFAQIQPKVIFSVCSVMYNGRRHNHLDKILQVSLGLTKLKKVVLIDDENKTDFVHIPNSCFLSEFLELSKDLSGIVPPLEFEQVTFDHPLCILYSSGTTGTPKGMVHSVGGTLIQHMKEHLLHGNMNREDVILYYSTVGWMMWNWLVSCLSLGSTVVLYDGSPFSPRPSVLFDLVDELGITILGTSAKGIATAEQLGLKPKETHKLDSLHAVLSTGSPLKPQSYDYVYKHIKEDILLGSITGGSDIVSCFAGQNPNLPVHRGEIQSQNLGMAMQCWDENGLQVYGSKGEMVCSKPFPSMPTHFWNDDDGVKYKNAYFNKFPGVWSHGDFCLINPDTRGIVMLGRSDSTLNPNGIRFGSSEIYNVVESFNEVQDSVCIPHTSKNGDERVVLFLKMRNGVELTCDLVDRIKMAIRQLLSARHVPAVFLPIMDIPYTISGKKVEIAVKKVVAGEMVTNRGALANPESLDLYKDVPELRNY